MENNSPNGLGELMCMHAFHDLFRRSICSNGGRPLAPFWLLVGSVFAPFCFPLVPFNCFRLLFSSVLISKSFPLAPKSANHLQDNHRHPRRQNSTLQLHLTKATCGTLPQALRLIVAQTPQHRSRGFPFLPPLSVSTMIAGTARFRHPPPAAPGTR